MKSLISLFCGVALVLYCSSCNKKTDTGNPPPPTNGNQVTVTLHPAGEFTTSTQSSMRSALPSVLTAARTAYDSTYYLVEVYTGTNLYALGRFDRLDSIRLLLDESVNYKIRLTVAQRGTGPGLYLKKGTNGLYTLGSPISGVLRNTMAYRPNIVGTGLGANYQAGTGIAINAKTPEVTHNDMVEVRNEITIFSGELANYTVDVNNPEITIPMRRLAFGIKYTCPQLTQGYLDVDYGGQRYYLPNKVFTPVNIDSSLAIYSCMDFILGDSVDFRITNYAVNATIVWRLPDGRNFTIADQRLPIPNRNKLLNVLVTLPSLDGTTDTGKSGISLKLSDTSFTSSTPIIF